MSTPLSHDLTYDAPLADVAAMLADPAFREAVCDAQHATSRAVSVSGTTESGSVEVTYTQAATGVPAFAKKLVGEEITITQRERWSGNTAALELTIPGKPGRITGTITLTESGGTTTERVGCDITVSVPLVGGKVERLIEEILRKALTKENQVGREWLAR